MALYLTPYLGAGTKADPFRPSGSDQAGWSAIDLRADKGVTQDGGGWGYALLWLPAGSSTPVGAVKIGDDKSEVAALSTRSFVSARLTLDFSHDVTVQDLIETLLVRPPKGWWNPIKPVKGRVEAWLGGPNGKERVVDFVLPAGGSISDAFNRANETPLAAPWTKNGSGGNINLSSNAITKAVANDSFYYYDYALGWNANQSCQFQYVTTVTSSDWGPAVRVGTGATLNGYWYSQASGGRFIEKFVGGSFSHIEAASGSTATSVPYKIDVTGSTISYYDNGSANANSPGTDTALSSGSPGVFMFQTGGSIDDFLATGETVLTTAPLFRGS